MPPPKGQLPEDWEDREQILFRSTEFGDDVDRPLIKSDGSPTYFAADIAYHYSKMRRGFRHMVDIWGADHGGYVKRMQAAVTALSGGEERESGGEAGPDRPVIAGWRAGENVQAGRRFRDIAGPRG